MEYLTSQGWKTKSSLIDCILYFDLNRNIHETSNFTISEDEYPIKYCVLNNHKLIHVLPEKDKEYISPYNLVYNRNGLNISNNKIREDCIRNSGISLKIRSCISRKTIRKISKSQAIIYLNNLIRLDGWNEGDTGYIYRFKYSDSLYSNFQELAIIAGMYSEIIGTSTPLFLLHRNTLPKIVFNNQIKSNQIYINEPDVFGYIIRLDGKVLLRAVDDL